MLARKKIEVELIDARLKESAMQSIAVLLSTLKHEINNPLGAVLGGAYLIRSIGSLDQSQQEALKLIEASGNRIKNVIKQLCEAAELEKVSKASEEVYHIPGDAPWGSKKDK
jgi:signal transduction histidine kinase